MLLNFLLSLPIFGCFLVGFTPYIYFRQMRIFGFFVTNLIYLLTLSI